MQVETFIRKVWLPTVLFIVAAVIVWWNRVSWAHVLGQLLSTALLTPVIWGAAIGKRRSPHLMRGMAVGALTGLLTQLAPHVQEMWQLQSRAGQGGGDEQLARGWEFAVYLIVGFWALIVGAFVGLVVTGIQRMVLQWTKVPGSEPDLLS